MTRQSLTQYIECISNDFYPNHRFSLYQDRHQDFSVDDIHRHCQVYAMILHDNIAVDYSVRIIHHFHSIRETLEYFL